MNGYMTRPGPYNGYYYTETRSWNYLCAVVAVEEREREPEMVEGKNTKQVIMVWIITFWGLANDEKLFFENTGDKVINTRILLTWDILI